MRLVLLFLSTVLLAPISTAFATSETDARALIVNEFRFLMSKRDFAAVEKFYSPFLLPNIRTPSGIWKLSVVEGDMGNQFYNRQGSTYWAQKEEFLTEWRMAFPKSTAAAIYAAEMYNIQAWDIRGSGMANTVAEAKWPAVHQMAGKARKELEQLGETGKRTPWWYSRMLEIALLANDGGVAERKAIALEGIKRHPGYYPIYFGAIYGLTPKWGGSYEEIDRFIEGAVKNPANKDGISLYARAYWYLDQAQTKGELFKLSKARWPLMKPAFDDLLKRYSSAWNMSAYAYFACQAEDYAVAEQLLNRLGNQLDLSAWSDRSGAEGAYNICKANIEQQAMDPAERKRLDEQAQQDAKSAIESIKKRSQNKDLDL
ncbi:DUF4034 domain-containing protein [Chitinilyticum aquatile]|uniref:DUF4034 domain-containing protein n=1 Tax=Chitinilyticum aquatile TaxID=362520 RepID=UPI000558502D|nr:DUF4034 domain-containing protein [Chitinilyticum aquatile]